MKGQRIAVAAIGICFILATAANEAARAADISGAGATFPYPIYAKWADAYKKLTGVGLNYQSIGSGGGIKQIKAKTVTFGASDMPLKPDDLNGGRLAAVSHDHRRRGAGGQPQGHRARSIASRRRDDCRHLHGGDRQVGRCPHQETQPRRRAAGDGDRSGLSIGRLRDEFPVLRLPVEGKPKFASSIGANTAVEWPKGIGAKGNEGVANMTSQTDGAIGYVEYAYAKQNKMTYATLTNKSGAVRLRRAPRPSRRRPRAPTGPRRIPII
jgi:phosphate transport system substrate-binding protein